MRIKVKSEVEVWTPDPAKPPNGAWRAGVVTWGNGHTYVMRWLDGGGPESGRIKRQFVRPCPPPVPLPVNLAAGDTVEVFDNNLWKLAEVVGGDAGNRQYVDVRIAGSTKVITANRVELRVQQRLTENDAWVVVNNEQGSAVRPRPVAGEQIKSKTNIKRSHNMMESDNIVGDKRFHSNSDTNKRLKSDAGGQSVASSSSSSSSSDDGSGSSSNGNNGGDDDADSVWEDEGAAVPVSCNKDDDQWSSADRAVSGGSAGTHHHRLSDEKPPPLLVAQQEEERDHHDMEVEAYASVMKALHASGPLDWGKEELLSSLRVHLHISGDEHLQVIWHLNGKKKKKKKPPSNGSS